MSMMQFPRQTFFYTRKPSPFVLALAVGLAASLCLTIPPTLARTPLKGSAVVTSSRFQATPYYPGNRTVQRADRLAAEYKLQAAESLYRNVLKYNSKDPGAWNGLGKIAYYKTTSSNQNLRDETDALQEQAIQHFLTALRYQPGYVEAHVNLATLYMERGRMLDAADELDKALSLSPGNAQALARRGEWLVRNRDYNEAVPVLQQAIKRDSRLESAHYYLSVAYTERNQLDEALAQLHSTLGLYPDHALAHHQMGMIYEKQYNGTAAVEHYLKALQLKPELEQTRRQLGAYYERHGDISAALEQYKRVAESTKADWGLMDLVARLSIRNRQPDVAVRYYRNWLDLHPEDAGKAQTGLALAKTELSRLKLKGDDLVSQGEARRYAEQALKYNPNNFEARLISTKLDREIGDEPSPLAGKTPGMVDVALQQPAYESHQSFEKGKLLLARYQFNEAERAFEAARRTWAGNRHQMVFGELFLTMGLPSLAEESFRLVLKDLPGNASARLGLGKARQAKSHADMLVAEATLLRKKDTLPIAIEKLNDALKADLKNAEAHYLMASLYERELDYMQAADHYYAYVQLEPTGEHADRAERKIRDLKVKIAKQQATP